MFENEDGDSKTNQTKARNLASLVREMYYPIRVCTPHQILRYSLQGKGWESMLSEFSHSVFIFDEIHAYNAKLVGLVMATVRYLVQNNAACLFITATLPSFLKELIEQEIPDIGFIEPPFSNEAEEADKADSTLVVCNHIPTAEAVYPLLKDNVSDTMLLHSQFTRKDRDENEKSSRSRLPKILISTQVVEVSLNLDFHQCITEPAAIDALVQRFGRVNRYGDRDPAIIRIFRRQYSRDNRIYSEELRNTSLEALLSLPLPLGEEDLSHKADEVYGNGYTDEDLTEYEGGLNYPQLLNWESYLTAGTSHDWVNQIIDDKEGTIGLLHETVTG